MVVTIAAALVAITATPAQTKQTASTRGDVQSVERTDPVPQGWSNTRYRLTPSDVLELTFPYVTEFNQTVTVQPDGYVTLRAVGLKREDLDEVARRALGYHPVKVNPRPVASEADVKQILELAW